MAEALDFVVGLGSNLGDRHEHLYRAVRALREVFDVRAVSRVYETAPVGPPQPDYLNAAVRARADLSPDEVLRVLLDVEQRGGRIRSPETRWGARTVDLDLLWAKGVVMSTPELTIPHPRLLERGFALLPLLDVAPEAEDPRTGSHFLAPQPDQAVRALSLLL